MLKFQDKSHLKLFLEYEPSTPIVRIFLKVK